MKGNRPTQEANLRYRSKEDANTSWHEIGSSFEGELLTKRRGLSLAVLPLAQFWFRLNLPLCNEESDLMAVPFGLRFG
jgi:hypothetical protein